MAGAAASSDAANVDSYIGSFICLISKSEIRYEGFMFHLDPKECTIGLRNVKSFGTENRRRDGPQIPPSERIYEYIYFRGKDIKDLQVLSAPSAQSTSGLPDDPAIIQQRPPPPPPAISLESSTASQPRTPSSDAQSELQAPSIPGNQPPTQSLEVPVSFASMAPAPLPVNVNEPAARNSHHGLTGLPGGTSRFQRKPFPPPPPQGLLLSNPVQQPMRHPNMNSPLAGSALNSTDAPLAFLPPACAGSQTFIATVPPPISITPSNIPLPTSFSNLTLNPSESKACGGLSTAMEDSSSLELSSSVASHDVNPAVPPVIQKESLLGPAPLPIVSKSFLSTACTSTASHGKISIMSHASMHQNLQPGLGESSSSMKDRNDDIEIICGSTNDPQLSDSDSENSKAAAIPPLEPVAIKLPEPASSSRYVNRRHIHNHGDGSNRGHAQGRGRGNLPNRAPMYSYQSYTGHPVGRGNMVMGAPFYPHYLPMVPVRGNVPNNAWYPRPHVGYHARGGFKVSPPPLTRFTEDFDFEAMNQKFNKEEVWDQLSKSKATETEDKEGDNKDDESSDKQDEAEDELPKPDQPVYCKDDFFDSISCRSLETDSGKGKMNVSERRKLDFETFGEMPKRRHDRGSQGYYRGRGSGNAGGGRGRGGYGGNRAT